MATKTITAVIASQTFTRAGKPKGYRYIALYSDNSREVIRENATRLYANAYHWDFRACSGPADGSLASRFTFGQSPAYPKQTPLAVYPVVLAGTRP